MFFIGLDLGQASDYTALVVCERVVLPAQAVTISNLGPMGSISLTESQARPMAQLAAELAPPAGADGAADPPAPMVHYHARHIERYPLGTTYPAIVRRVAALTRTAPIAGNFALAVDATGVGRPVVNMLWEAGVTLTAVMITGGASLNTTDDGFTHVPKRDLISSVQVVLQSGRLKFAHSLPEAQTLISELLTYQIKITDSAHDTYNAREGAHDDLLLALALAVWHAEQYVSPLDLIAWTV